MVGFIPGEIQAFLDFDHSLAQLMDRINEDKGFEWIRILISFSDCYQSGLKLEASSNHPKDLTHYKDIRVQ